MTMLGALVSGCATTSPPPPTVPYVDLPRFMGDWYVVGGILTSFEKGAHHAIENYRLDEKGRIQTTFTFRKDSFDGPLKKFTPVGFVHNKETFAEWRMQFIWPFKSPFLIIYLDPDYRATAISTHDRKYLWRRDGGLAVLAIPCDLARGIQFPREKLHSQISCPWLF